MGKAVWAVDHRSHNCAAPSGGAFQRTQGISESTTLQAQTQVQTIVIAVTQIEAHSRESGITSDRKIFGNNVLCSAHRVSHAGTGMRVSFRTCDAYQVREWAQAKGMGAGRKRGIYSSRGEHTQRMQENLASYRLDSLRHCMSAGEPLNPEVISKWKAATGLMMYACD